MSNDPLRIKPVRTSFIEQWRHARKYGQLRPLWQIALLLPVYPLYAAMRWIVEKVEGR